MKQFCLALTLSAFFLISPSNPLLAQDDEVKPATVEQKKPWYLSFQLDAGLKGWGFTERYYYEGEYREFDFNTGEENWSWIINDIDTSYNSADLKAYSLRLGVTFTWMERLHLGFSYHPFVLTDLVKENYGGYQSSYRETILSSFAMAALVEYEHPLEKVPFLRPFSSIAIGTYQGNDGYEGVGSEFFAEGKLGVALMHKNKIGLRFFCAHNYQRYRENSQSEYFLREQDKKVDIHSNHVGAGLIYRFTMIPD